MKIIKYKLIPVLFLGALVFCVWPTVDKEVQKDPLTVHRNLLSKESAHDGTTKKQSIISSKTSHRSLGGLSPKSLLQRWTSNLQCSVENDEDIGNIEGMNSKRTGFILALNFHEQQTKASDNLFSLQCWAKTLFVNIVEPLIMNSHFTIPLNENQSGLPNYRDIFDIRIRHLLSIQYKFAPLASWETFVKKAPRKLIVVQFRYLTVRELKKQKDGMKKATHLAVNNKYQQGCETSLELLEKIKYLKAMHNFIVVREVCFNFAEGDKLTLSQFNHHLYGGIGPKTVTVLMEEWRGLSTVENGKRVVLTDACWMPIRVEPLLYTWPSQQLICDATKYKEKFLKTDNYITLMVRTEKIGYKNFTSGRTNLDNMARCLNKTLKIWKALKASMGIENTFLSMDIGKYGSYGLMNKKGRKKYRPYINLYMDFFRQLFGPLATIKRWESRFEEVTSKHDSGYIGSLQKTIAAKSKCIIFTGGGLFQRHTKFIYDRINSNKKKKCTRIVHKCSKKMSP